MHRLRILRGDKRNSAFKKTLRSNMTLAERKLWSKLRRAQFKSLRFRRQHGIGPYIVGFYCPEKQIVIEVDGDVHAFSNRADLDREREKFLERLGIRVIRYQNNDVLKNIDGVMEHLWSTLN